MDADSSFLSAGPTRVWTASPPPPTDAVRTVVLADARVWQLHGTELSHSIGRHSPVDVLLLPPGERCKSVRVLERVWAWLAERGVERSDRLVAVGGGAACDLGGLAAATWLRGIGLTLVPTTLLAQVDASVGGKVAVNGPTAKNQLGTFYPAHDVWMPAWTLATLGRRDWASGWAEVVKTALLAGGTLFDRVAGLPVPGQGRRPVETSKLSRVIADCVAFKAAVVGRDPTEKGERAILNLGHTAGHALESLGNYRRFRHGEAVRHGLRVALLLSGRGPGTPEWASVTRIPAPPTTGIAVDDVWSLLSRDKKARGGRPRWVLVESPGRPRWGVEMPEVEVRAALARALGEA